MESSGLVVLAGLGDHLLATGVGDEAGAYVVPPGKVRHSCPSASSRSYTYRVYECTAADRARAERLAECVAEGVEGDFCYFVGVFSCFGQEAGTRAEYAPGEVGSE